MEASGERIPPRKVARSFDGNHCRGLRSNLWERTWAAALPRVAAAGLLTAEQGEALITAAERHTASRDVWVAAAKMFAAVGAKPA